MAAVQTHVLVEDVHGIDLRRAFVEEELRVVHGHVAGVLVVLVVRLGLGEDDLEPGFGALEGCRGSRVAGAYDQNVAAAVFLGLERRLLA